MTVPAKLLVVSDRVSRGESEDLSGPLLRARLLEADYDVVEVRVVADGIDSVAGALREMSTGFSGLLVTTGGTGFAPRDLTPEATRQILDREAPGFGEVMRASHRLGPLSRSVAGTTGNCLIVNTPGSPSGAVECFEALEELLVHALGLLRGAHGAHPPDTGGSTATSS